MAITTSQLFNRLSRSSDINTYIEEYGHEFHSISFPQLLNDLAAEKKMSVADIAKRSLQTDYVYKVFRGERKPSRDVVIAIAVGMTLHSDEAQLLLRISKNAMLDPRDKRDSIVLYALKEKLSAEALNDLLYELNEVTL